MLIATCNICGSPNVEYICTKCGSLLCSKCLKIEEKVLFYCMDCGSDNISQIKEDDNYTLVCASCGSKNIGQGKKIYKSCPSCGGEVKKITQMLQQTKMNFKLILSRLNKITTDFLRINTELSGSKEKLLAIRKKGYFMKAHLDRFTYELIVNFEAVVNQTLFYLDQIEKHNIYQPMNKEALLLNPSAFLSLDKEIAKAIANLAELNQYITLALKELREKIKYLNSELLLLERDVEFIESHLDLLSLGDNEVKIGIFRNVKITKSDFIKKVKQEGVLILTSEHLTFLSIDKKKNLIKKGFRINNKHIMDAIIEGKRSKSLKIAVTFGTITLSVPKNDLEPLFNILKIMPYSSNGNNSYLMPVTLESYSPDASKITTKISSIIKRFKTSSGNKIKSKQFSSVNSYRPLQKSITSQHLQRNRQNQQQLPEFELPFVRKNMVQRQNDENNYYRNNQTYSTFVDSSTKQYSVDYDLLNKLKSRRQAILKSIEMLDRHFQEGRITYDAYIKYYTSLYAEYYRIEGEIQRIKRNDVVTKL